MRRGQFLSQNTEPVSHWCQYKDASLSCKYCTRNFGSRTQVSLNPGLIRSSYLNFHPGEYNLRKPDTCHCMITIMVHKNRSSNPVYRIRILKRPSTESQRHLITSLQIYILVVLCIINARIDCCSMQSGLWTLTLVLVILTVIGKRRPFCTVSDGHILKLQWRHHL